MKFSSFIFKIVASKGTCFLSLTHPRGDLPVTATLAYPNEVIESYARWQQAYLQFYRHYRGRREAGGTLLQEPVNLDTNLESARVDLLQKFEQWLKDGNLQSIRDSISGLRMQANVQPRLFLSCESLELARLPWEAWSLLQASASNTAQHSSHQTTNHPKISLFRIPGTGNEQKAQSQNKQKQRRRKPRILVIIGSDGYFNFQADFAKIQQKLARKVDLQQAGWEPGIEPLALKQKLATAIADPIGWDMLYFAGHSNETQSTGGEFAIAPNLWLQMSELHPDLEIAIQNGLQFAFFNSCSGINIADSLLQMGLSQVAIMREPIANQVAEKIMGIFLEQLLEYHDVAVALAMACQQLEYSDRLKYPSAYLVPSFYCTPNTTLFQLDDNWRRWVKLWKPTKWEAIALTALTVISLSPPLRNPAILFDPLLEQRLYLQSIYRQLRNPDFLSNPPIILVDLDEASLRDEEIKTNPIDRRYLAKLVTRLEELNARIIAFDYLLDRPIPEQDKVLADAIQASIERNKTWFIFAAKKTSDEFIGVHPNIANQNFVLQASVNAFPQYARIPSSRFDCDRPLMGHLLSLSVGMRQANFSDLPKPNLKSKSNFCQQLNSYLTQRPIQDKTLKFLQEIHISPITAFLSSLVPRTFWLEPINDFSIPPQQIYYRVSAKDLINRSKHQDLKQLGVSNKVFLIAGSYFGGIDDNHDNFNVPAPIKYRSQQKWFIGAESHAYTAHHLLNQHLISMMPDLAMMLVMFIVGRSLLFIFIDSRDVGQVVIFCLFLGVVYVITSFELYLSFQIGISCLLPVLVFYISVFPIFRSYLLCLISTSKISLDLSSIFQR